MNTPTMPSDLPSDRYITRAERLAHQSQIDDYVAHCRDIEAKERDKHKRAEPTGPRTLTDTEYDDFKRQQWEAEQARRAEQQAAEKAETDSRKAFLESTPATVNIVSANDFQFLMEFAHRVRQGYELHPHSVTSFVLGCYSADMVLPATKAKAK